MDELGLQLLQPRLGLLTLREVADEPGEEALIARAHLADGEFHRESRAVLALADDDAPDPDDAPLPGSQIALQVAVVILSIGRRHQPFDVRADDFRRRIAEQSFGCRAEGLDDPALVDHDHRIGHGVQDRGEMGLARNRLARSRPPEVDCAAIAHRSKRHPLRSTGMQWRWRFPRRNMRAPGMANRPSSVARPVAASPGPIRPARRPPGRPARTANRAIDRAGPARARSLPTRRQPPRGAPYRRAAAWA